MKNTAFKQTTSSTLGKRLHDGAEETIPTVTTEHTLIKPTPIRLDKSGLSPKNFFEIFGEDRNVILTEFKRLQAAADENAKYMQDYFNEPIQRGYISIKNQTQLPLPCDAELKKLLCSKNKSITEYQGYMLSLKLHDVLDKGHEKQQGGKESYLKELEQLIKAGADLNSTLDGLRTALETAKIKEDTELLIEHGAKDDVYATLKRSFYTHKLNPNIAHSAAVEGKSEKLEYVLGITKNIYDNIEETPTFFFCALRQNHNSCAQIALEHARKNLPKDKFEAYINKPDAFYISQPYPKPAQTEIKVTCKPLQLLDNQLANNTKLREQDLESIASILPDLLEVEEDYASIINKVTPISSRYLNPFDLVNTVASFATNKGDRVINKLMNILIKHKVSSNIPFDRNIGTKDKPITPIIILIKNKQIEMFETFVKKKRIA